MTALSKWFIAWQMKSIKQRLAMLIVKTRKNKRSNRR
jgi:hypothetical protein